MGMGMGIEVRVNGGHGNYIIIYLLVSAEMVRTIAQIVAVRINNYAVFSFSKLYIVPIRMLMAVDNGLKPSFVAQLCLDVCDVRDSSEMRDVCDVCDLLSSSLAD